MSEQPGEAGVQQVHWGHEERKSEDGGGAGNIQGGERRVVRTWMRMRMAQRAISETTWGAENARSGSCCC